MYVRTGLIALLLSLGVMLAGCPGNHDHGPANAAQGGLRLDDGRKWQADDHTRASAARMRDAISSADASTVEAARALGSRLQKELDELIRGCTMTGAAHDQLHVFLGRLMPAVDSLAKAADVAAAEKALASVRELLETYDRHFE
ncbi:MAG: hypothetical protein IT464_14120 [Planctomycetes bacterium]|nr:hypothetical protein [Planctomycetota bacterium]